MNEPRDLWKKALLCEMLAAGCVFLCAGAAMSNQTNAVATGSKAASAAMETGLDREAVVRLIGTPQGNLIRGNYEILYYGDRGSVTLSDGLVVFYKIISEEEAKLAAAQRAREAAARAAEEAAERERRIAEGTAEKQRAVSDPAFAALEPDKRMEFWRNFVKTYPEIPASLELAAAEDEAGSAAKTRMSADPSFQALPPEERIKRWEDFAAKYPRIPVAEEIQLARSQAGGANSKSIAEKITALEAAAKDAEVRSHWSGKWTHRKAIREYISLTNEIATLRSQQEQGSAGKAAENAVEQTGESTEAETVEDEIPTPVEQPEPAPAQPPPSEEPVETPQVVNPEDQTQVPRSAEGESSTGIERAPAVTGRLLNQAAA